MKIKKLSHTTLNQAWLRANPLGRILTYKAPLPVGLNLLGHSSNYRKEKSYSCVPSSNESKTFFLTKHKITVETEIYFQPRTKNATEQTFLISKINDITKKSWEDFGEVVHQWFEWADMLVLARVDGEVIGFNACCFQDNKAILFLASFVLPDYQSGDIAKIMQNLMIKKFLLSRGKKRFFSPAWFTFRTQNPRVMQTIAKFNAFPSISGRSKPGANEIHIAKKVAARFSPHCEFDETHFVLKEALKSKPDLLGKDKVFYSKNQDLNAFCDKHLEYDKQAGHLFIPVGRLSWLHKLYFLLMF